MTASEITKAQPDTVPYPKRHELETGDFTSFHIPRYTLGPLAFHVFLAVDATSGQLSQISLEPIQQDRSEAAYTVLQGLLEKDFGAPKSKVIEDNSTTVVWLLPSTAVRLTRRRMRMPEFDLQVPDLLKTELTIRTNHAFPNLPYNAAWNMPPESVRKLSVSIESADTNNASMRLTALAELAGKKAKLFYSFADNRLWKVDYSFTADHAVRNDFIDDYQNICEYLEEQYGAPAKSDTSWHNQLFLTDPRSWGLAVSRGDLRYTSLWRTRDSDITLELAGQNLKSELKLRFKSRALSLVFDEPSTTDEKFIKAD